METHRISASCAETTSSYRFLFYWDCFDFADPFHILFILSTWLASPSTFFSSLNPNWALFRFILWVCLFLELMSGIFSYFLAFWLSGQRFWRVPFFTRVYKCTSHVEHMKLLRILCAPEPQGPYFFLLLECHRELALTLQRDTNTTLDAEEAKSIGSIFSSLCA